MNILKLLRSVCGWILHNIEAYGTHNNIPNKYIWEIDNFVIKRDIFGGFSSILKNLNVVKYI
jgi:hypothetical protein